MCGYVSYLYMSYIYLYTGILYVCIYIYTYTCTYVQRLKYVYNYIDIEYFPFRNTFSYIFALSDMKWNCYLYIFTCTHTLTLIDTKVGNMYVYVNYINGKHWVTQRYIHIFFVDCVHVSCFGIVWFVLFSVFFFLNYIFTIVSEALGCLCILYIFSHFTVFLYFLPQMP